MLPDQAFLRKIPAIVNAAQAIQLEALVYSSDAIESCLSAIRGIAGGFQERIMEIPRPLRTSLFINAWTVVDCIHVIRQVLIANDYRTPQAESFITKYDTARRLRNNMDHIVGLAQNVANTKSASPIFGSLTYIHIPAGNINTAGEQVTITGGGSVMLLAGRVRGKQQSTFVNPAGRNIRGHVSCFHLEAFNEILNLEEAEDDLRLLIAEINDRFEGSTAEHAQKISTEHNIPIEKLMENPAGDVTFYLAFNFDPQERNSAAYSTNTPPPISA